MTEKEKQIIEMAGDMSFASTKADLYLYDRKEIAKVLYLLGYRKVPDGAVVLTKEEYEVLLAKQEYLEKRYSDMRNDVIFYKTETETLTQYHIQLEQDLAEARKETAKEILQTIKLLFNEKEWYTVVSHEKTYKVIDEIAKQYGVEVE